MGSASKMLAVLIIKSYKSPSSSSSSSTQIYPELSITLSWGYGAVGSSVGGNCQRKDLEETGWELDTEGHGCGQVRKRGGLQGRRVP